MIRMFSATLFDTRRLVVSLILIVLDLLVEIYAIMGIQNPERVVYDFVGSNHFGYYSRINRILPVSSRYLILAKELFGIQHGKYCLEIVVHAATVLSTITVFRKEIGELIFIIFQIRGILRHNTLQKFSSP